MSDSQRATHASEGPWLERLSDKWHEVPSHVKGRLSTKDLQALDDDSLLSLWKDVHRHNVDGWVMRGWYHQLYRPLWASGVRVLDIGSGFGIDGLTWAGLGARVTCADIVASNLDVLRRLSRLLEIDTIDLLHIAALSAFDTLPDGSVDVVYAQGSLHHAPPEIIVPEVARVVPKLRIGVRWIQLAYPRERWLREGRPPLRDLGAPDRWRADAVCRMVQPGKITDRSGSLYV